MPKRDARPRPDESDDDAPARKDWMREVHNQARASGRVFAVADAAERHEVQPNNAPVAPGPKAEASITGNFAIAFATGNNNDRGFIVEYAAALKADGVSGVWCGALPCDSHVLTVEQRKELVTSWAQSQLALIVDISAPALSDVKALAVHAVNSGARAVTISLPNVVSSPTANDIVNYLVDVSSVCHGATLLFHHTPSRFPGASYRLIEVLQSASRTSIRGFIFEDSNVSDLSACIHHMKTNKLLSIAVHADDATATAAAILGVNSFASAHFSTVNPLLSKLLIAAQKGDAATLTKLQPLAIAYFAMVAEFSGNTRDRAACVAKAIASFRLERDLGLLESPAPRLTVLEMQRLRSAMEAFVSQYKSSMGPSQQTTKTNINLFSMSGFLGKLDDKIRNRAEACGHAARIRNVLQFFPHLNSKWRGALPSEDCNLAQYIDHTILKPEATEVEVSKLTEEARKHKFFAVCVNGCRVEQCLRELRGTKVQVAAVIGFPLGAMTTKAKAREARELVQMGVTEIDMVMNVGAMKDADLQLVYEDIKAVVDASKPALVKVIFETCLLTADEIMDASILSVAAGAGFLKTSTGFNKGGATPEAIDIMLAVAGNECQVKASGGVRTRIDSLAYVTAGVTRIGTSSGIAIVTGAAAGSGY
jgi:deoxyribose-phosphate aldolase